MAILNNGEWCGKHSFCNYWRIYANIPINWIGLANWPTPANFKRPMPLPLYINGKILRNSISWAERNRYWISCKLPFLIRATNRPFASRRKWSRAWRQSQIWCHLTSPRGKGCWCNLTDMGHLIIQIQILSKLINLVVIKKYQIVEIWILIICQRNMEIYH